MKFLTKDSIAAEALFSLERTEIREIHSADESSSFREAEKNHAPSRRIFAESATNAARETPRRRNPKRERERERERESREGKGECSSPRSLALELIAGAMMISGSRPLPLFGRGFNHPSSAVAGFGGINATGGSFRAAPATGEFSLFDCSIRLLID